MKILVPLLCIHYETNLIKDCTGRVSYWRAGKGSRLSLFGQGRTLGRGHSLCYYPRAVCEGQICIRLRSWIQKTTQERDGVWTPRNGVIVVVLFFVSHAVVRWLKTNRTEPFFFLPLLASQRLSPFFIVFSEIWRTPANLSGANLARKR